ncbi:AI-2E family transporter [Caldimonas tepidiphila]|uniref:AI-2E family transporter n=1 Tax=Caldimonas tepidiphila TaxID=2315841 RepID=UPI000E5ADEF0|nr:AI-2E family transporter [Caldimonas tepidiphila]
MPRPTDDSWSFLQLLLLTTAVVVLLLLLLLWQLSSVAVLAFGGIVMATMLRGIARRLERWTGASPQVSAVLAALLVLAVLAVVGWLVGGAFAEQITRLREQLPQAWAAASSWLASHALGRQLLDVLQGAMDSGLTGNRLARVAGTTLGALGTALLIAIVGVYLAADAPTYRKGVLRLVPPAYRDRAGEALDASGRALSCWLLGQGLSMIFLGTSTAIGLWLLGIPLALALGLITGLLAFVPFFGAITAGLLSVLMAFIEGPQKALHVALLFFALQQVEDYLLLPFVQRWAVALPPVLTLFSALIFGILFGPVGVVFATPMMVIALVLVRKLYIEDTLQSGQESGEARGRAAQTG